MLHVLGIPSHQVLVNVHFVDPRRNVGVLRQRTVLAQVDGHIGNAGSDSGRGGAFDQELDVGKLGASGRRETLVPAELDGLAVLLRNGDLLPIGGIDQLRFSNAKALALDVTSKCAKGRTGGNSHFLLRGVVGLLNDGAASLNLLSQTLRH